MHVYNQDMTVLENCSFVEDSFREYDIENDNKDNRNDHDNQNMS